MEWKPDGGNPWVRRGGSRRRAIAYGESAPLDASGKTVSIGEINAQTIQSFEIIKRALEQAASGVRDLVRTLMIPTDIYKLKQAIQTRKICCRDTRSGNAPPQGFALAATWRAPTRLRASAAERRCGSCASACEARYLDAGGGSKRSLA